MSCLDMSWEEIQEALREQELRSAESVAVVAEGQLAAVEPERKGA